jgi:hypothetical protein
MRVASDQTLQTLLAPSGGVFFVPFPQEGQRGTVVTTTKIAAKTRLRALDWTGNSLTLNETAADISSVIANMATYTDVIAAVRTAVLVGGEVPIAGAFACALAASTLLREGTHDYYSRLLHAVRAIQQAAPGNAALTDAVRRVLAAGDEADGPANGHEAVAAAMTAEAVRISQGPAGTPAAAGGP